MLIINNQYRSTCRPSTSITRRSLGLTASIHLSMISCGILFHSSSMASFKESTSVIFPIQHHFPNRHQLSFLLDSSLDYSVTSDGT